MLNFKVGQFYKDTNGKEWRFCGYYPNSHYPYIFIDKKGCVLTSLEKSDNLVTEYNYNDGVKIPFVEEKERDWVIGEEYECIDSLTQSVVMARLAKIIKETDSHLIYVFNIDGVHFSFHHEGRVLIMGRFAIFKDGIPQGLKDRLNKKEKLTNKQKCFQKGQVYTKTNGNKYIFKKRIKTKQGLIAIFEDEEGFIIFSGLRKLNNIECVGNVFDKLELFADESIKGENTYKAVRVMQ